MAAFTVRTPVAGSTDKIGAVQFVDGTAQVDDEVHAAELRYFRQAGYGVEAHEEPASEPDLTESADGLPKKSASTETWRAYAAAHGIEDPDEFTRDELVAHFYKEDGQ